MKVFTFVDRVEQASADSMTALFTLKGSEEILQDHFESFPVMPGVLLLEAVKQVSAKFLAEKKQTSDSHFRLVSAMDVKFGYFVKPGSTLKIFSRLIDEKESKARFEGRIDLIAPETKAKVFVATLELEAL